MSATRTGRRIALATSLTGLLAAPLAVIATATPAHAAPTTIQILGTNDFHGRLVSEGTTGTTPAGAAQFAGAIEQYRADPTVGGTVFAAAGDLVGASTFESFIQQDKPTLDAMNAMGLDVSAAGNHEFDAGYGDLVNRIMKPYDASTNPAGGAEWQYLAANVRKKSDNTYALPDVAASPGTSDGGTWMTTVDGVDVGFVGAVTEDLPSLVSPSGIADVKVTSIVDEVKTGAAALKAAGADVVVMLVHEGSSTNNCSGVSDDSAFGKIVKGVGTNVNAIISGHTHLAYNCTVDGVPVVSSGQYGTNFNVLKFTVDTSVPSVSVASQAIVSANSVALTAQSAIDKKAEVKTIVDAAVAKADVLGARELGKLGGAFNRAKLADGTTENRGGESTLGNLVAEVQRWATSTPEAGAAQIAFMNPGGLRTDMAGTNGTLSYKQAAVVQPFANTLVNMKLTGAQIKTVLEQQWQRDAGGAVPSRAFLRLGVSEGFFSTYDPTKPEGSRVTGMWLNGKAIDPATAYSVTVNSFLATGGDNFRGFNAGTAKRDTGKVDLQAMVDYMATFAATTPLKVKGDQRQVGVSLPADAPRFYRLGGEIKLNLSSLAMSTPADAKDPTLAVKLGDAGRASAKVDNTISAVQNDESGTSAVSVKLTGKVRKGKQMLTFTGPSTGTSFSIPVDVRKAKPEVKARVNPGRIVKGKTRARVKIKASALGIKAVNGKVIVKVGGKKYTAKLKKGKAIVRLDRFAKTGTKRVVVKYAGSQKVRGKQAVVKIKVRKR
ncbi:bifunctional metallophosphatase/5'-nucleotidase [Nocardioides hwasunensis]|uniref:5'-nucleotidase C-terminal domain-containing protein n=1 Tax=Nocardioides hwasunensis TaxID=397258 RepID=A0ABR8MF34_9ACTN|nr:5'-nucleotidase C-terminal domain-containing protein [Nocardioides hwasunensis]MBD3914709.1 5'-nucleotidase C-terminal domain-containing protein [Nocardioides hwasunensis]